MLLGSRNSAQTFGWVRGLAGRLPVLTLATPWPMEARLLHPRVAHSACGLRLSSRPSPRWQDHGLDQYCLTRRASVLRQLRAAGIDLPVFGRTDMDGTYWLSSVTGPKNFYLPSQALPNNDPRSELNHISSAFKKKDGAAPSTQFA